MNETINYNFSVSRNAADDLDDIGNEIKSDVCVHLKRALERLRKSCDSEAHFLIAEKSECLIDEIKSTGNMIIFQAERIDKISRKLLIIEQEAENTAKLSE